MGKKLTIKITSVINIILTIFTAALYIMYNSSNIVSFDKVINILAGVSIILVIWYVILCIKEHVKLYDFKLWYIIFNTLFIMGQVLVCFFGKGEEFIYWKIIFRVEPKYILGGGLLALAIQQAIVTALFFKTKPLSESKKQKKYSNKLLWYTGVSVFLLLIPFKIYYDLVYIKTAKLATGYVSSAYIDINGMVTCLGLVAVTGLFYMIESKYLSYKAMKKLMIPIILYFVAVMALTGDRRYTVVALICIVLSFIHSYKIKIKPITIIGVLLLGSIALSTLSVIRSTRSTGGIDSIFTFLSLVLEKSFSFDIIWDSLSEFGLTLMCYTYTFKYIPAVIPFKYGEHLLLNLIAILPVGPLLNSWKARVDIHTQVFSMTNTPVGTAFGSDLYGNFGTFSILVAFLFGLLISKLLNVKKIEESNYEAAKYFSLMYIFINMVRAGFAELFRFGFYSYIIPVIIMALLSRKSSKKVEN